MTSLHRLSGFFFLYLLFSLTFFSFSFFFFLRGSRRLLFYWYMYICVYIGTRIGAVCNYDGDFALLVSQLRRTGISREIAREQSLAAVFDFTARQTTPEILTLR